MAYLIDTSILLRLANTSDPAHAEADRAVNRLDGQGETLWITAQNLVEFRSVATRPFSVNGLGLLVADAEGKAYGFEAFFSLLAETPAIFPAWKALVSGLAIVGKQVHDARLVAVCHVHQVTHILTFNVAHFGRLAAFGPGLVVVHPSSV